MIIRTQFNNTLITDKFIYYIYYTRCTDNKSGIAKIRVKEKINVNDCKDYDDFLTLATYTSYDKAVKVLNDLETALKLNMPFVFPRDEEVEKV